MVELDGLKKLEYLSLVSKVCMELESHLGSGDKVVAEFITELGRNCRTVEEFDAKLKENGAEMPDYFVRTLLTIIQAILLPDDGGKEKSREDGDWDGRKEKYQGLAIRNDVDRVREIEKEIENEVKERSRYRERDGGGRGDRGRRRDRYDREDRRRDRGEDDDDRRDRHRDRDRDRREKGYGDEDEYGKSICTGRLLHEQLEEIVSNFYAAVAPPLDDRLVEDGNSSGSSR